jgi:pimeloyl-ACP methyl ester carboxylesterase
MEARKLFRDGVRRFTTDEVLSMSYDMQHTLPTLTQHIPTIFMWGEKDTFAPPALGRELAPLLPDVPFHWIPNAGHQAQNDQPELASKVMLEFLQGAVAVTGKP